MLVKKYNTRLAAQQTVSMKGGNIKLGDGHMLDCVLLRMDDEFRKLEYCLVA